MNDLPRHTLARIIAEHGRGICAAPKRVEALLRDLCGAHRREINIISGALEERVAADLIASANSVPRDVLLARLAARLRDNLAYTPEAARWGVETWAVALGIMSEAELQERARRESAEARRSNAQPTVSDAQTPAGNSPNVNSQASQPQRGTTYASTPQPTPTPQQPAPTPQTSPQQQSSRTSAPPPVFRQPAPAPRRTPTVQPNVIVAGSSQQGVSPSLPARQTSRRWLTLRGCLIIVVLIIALIATVTFVVPAVLFLLQEEQARPSINEPRIQR
jgi:hypothetical protein